MEGAALTVRRYILVYDDVQYVMDSAATAPIDSKDCVAAEVVSLPIPSIVSLPWYHSFRKVFSFLKLIIITQIIITISMLV